MFQEILKALKAKFPGVSDSVLSRIAKNLAKTVTKAELVESAVEGISIQQVIESYGDSRATEASNTARENAVKDYEKRYGLKDGVKTTDDNNGGEDRVENTTNQGGGEEMPSWAQKLFGELAELKANRTTETRTQQLNAVIGKLPEAMKKAYERLPLDKYTDEEFTKMLGEITTEVEGIEDNTAAKGGVFGKPSASTGGQPAELTEAQKAAISRREGVPADGEQPF